MWWKGAISVTKTPLIELQISGWEKITNIAVTKNKCRFEGSLPPISPSREATQSSPTLIRGLNHHIFITLHLMIISYYLIKWTVITLFFYIKSPPNYIIFILEDPLLIISAIRNPAITIMSDCHDNVSPCNKTLRYIIARLGAELSCLLPEGQEARVKALPNRWALWYWHIWHYLSTLKRMISFMNSPILGTSLNYLSVQ